MAEAAFTANKVVAEAASTADEVVRELRSRRMKWWLRLRPRRTLSKIVFFQIFVKIVLCENPIYPLPPLSLVRRLMRGFVLLSRFGVAVTLPVAPENWTLLVI